MAESTSGREGTGPAGVGTVFLVGAGPGHPGLLTVRGRELLYAADAIVYDRLASTVLPPDLPAETELHYVGKHAGRHTLKQEGINELLVRLARAGKSVCRFKGGDPFVFGRGGEEAEALRAAGVPFEVVPGVTAGIAAAAFAGIPVTHRGVAIRVTLVTAHEDPEKISTQVDWRRLGADSHQTVVAYMPVANLPAIAAELIAGGMDPQTPCAVIERGTLPSQRTLTAPLGQLPEAVAAAGVGPPALLVVGHTAALHERLAWIRESFGPAKRVVVTRPGDQAAELIAGLWRIGIEPLVCPTLRVFQAPESELLPLRDDLGRYDWLFFTSGNGVRTFFALLAKLDLDVRALSAVKIAAIGSGTADCLRQHHLNADFLPTAFQSGVLLPEFLAQGPVAGLRILRVRGDLAPTHLEDGLREAGARVDTVTTYRTVPDEVRQDVLDLMATEQIDAVTFTSGSTVESFESLAVVRELHARIPAVCIGPVTARSARQVGWETVVTAKVNTIAGLIDALVELLNAEDSLPG